jgi:LysR family cys regulon transcriptional activator
MDAGHLFKSSLLNVSIRKHTYLRSYLLSFISLYAPHLPRSVVQQAMEGVDIDIAQMKVKAPVLT